MPTAESAVSSLNIHRLRSLYLVPSDHPAPDAIRSKLDNVARRKFGDAIASALSRALPDSTAGVWLIRSLTLNVDLNLDASEDRLAEIWARQAAVSVAMVLQDNAKADQVLHFASSAAHLAHFLRDLADGSAWDKWYYRKFDGLRSLPLSAALRTAVCREPLIGLEALQQISDSAARRVFSVLTEHDAKWILNEIAGGDLPERQFSFEQINPQSVFRPVLDGENRAALHLYLRLSRQHPETAGAQLKTLVIALVCLTRCLQQPSLISALADGDAVALLQMLVPADAERLLPLLESPREWLESLAQSAELPTASSVAAHETRHTAAGGVFLLLLLLDAMPIAEATQHWPKLLGCAPASLVRWIILMKCFGTAGAGQVFHDPLVRDLLGLAPQIDASSLKDWQRSLTRKQLLDFQSQIARWQFGNAIETQHSISALVAGRKPQSLLCCDRSRISLLLALPNSPSSRKLLLETLSAWPAVADSADTPESDENQLAGSPLADADLQSLLRDLDFLRLPVAFSGSHRSELTFSVAARALLRNFSGRLMGFSQSGLEYLFSNFLDFHASVQTESDQSTVRVGQPPLHVVLSLAGMNRQSYSLSWRPGTYALFPD